MARATEVADKATSMASWARSQEVTLAWMRCIHAAIHTAVKALQVTPAELGFTPFSHGQLAAAAEGLMATGTHQLHGARVHLDGCKEFAIEVNVPDSDELWAITPAATARVVRIDTHQPQQVTSIGDLL